MGQIAKQSIQGTIVTYLGVALGFITTFFVLTRFLTAEEVGLARVMVDAATLFVGLAQLGTSSSIIRFFPYFSSSEGTHGFFFWTLLVPLVGFALFALVYVACHTPLSAFFGDKSPLFVNYYYLVLPIAFFMLYQTVFETNANVLMHIVLPRFVREVVVRLGLLIAYLLYAFRWLSMDGFIWSFCATYAVAALINMGYVAKLCMAHGSMAAMLTPDWTFLRAQRPLVRSYLLYTLFLLVSAVTSVLAPMLSSFFITAQMGLSYTGIFAIATYMAVMVSIPYRSLVAIVQPELSVAVKNDDSSAIARLIHQSSANLMLVGGLILLVIWINIDLIYVILPNGALYASARNVVLLLGVGQLMVASFNVFLPALSYSRWYAFALLNSLVLTVSALLLNNYLIPHWGMMGAAWATVIADTVYYILVIVVASCALHIRPFSRGQLLIVLLLAVAFVLNYLWTAYLSAFIADGSVVWDALLRTLVIFAPTFYLAYRLNLSPEIHQYITSLTNHKSQITNHQSPITNHKSQITNHK
ncbi:MAG: lipopolysaccharide biosynthesis protein [Paludibacteraceae bacterium]|nr:lipopolysaccharide biosynthesis protein [Paludibacteraceae bacterium]